MPRSSLGKQKGVYVTHILIIVYHGWKLGQELKPDQRRDRDLGEKLLTVWLSDRLSSRGLLSWLFHMTEVKTPGLTVPHQ